MSHLIEYRLRLCETEAKFYISEGISGFEKLQTLGMVYLDIKAGNIHLAYFGHVMIADFNCAYDIALNKERLKPNDFRGSLGFMAPEIRIRRLISFAADIFSMGVAMLTLLIGYTLNYENDDHLNPAIFMWEIDFEKHFSLILQVFLKACLEFDPNVRLNLDEIRRLELFSDTNRCKGAL